jgi:uncharacterized protein YkwD
MRTAFRPLACLLVLLAAVSTASSQNDPRQELLRLINADRQRAGAPPLRISELLTRAAEEHAAEVARRGSLETGSTEDMRQRLKRLGYQAYSWTERLATSHGDPATVLREWRRGDAAGYRELLGSEVRDLGIGLGRLGRSPLYVFLYTVPEGDWFARGTSGVRDLDRVRAEMLARVNDVRKKAGAQPLRSNSKLDLAAQRHAEDMLTRNYFAHASPEKKTVRERATAAGYDWQRIGENIAEGQFSVDEVMDTWMNSPGHRKNILEPGFKELGVGLALGPTGRGGHRILWAQTFGTR